jgi:hypothetical protein
MNENTPTASSQPTYLQSSAAQKAEVMTKMIDNSIRHAQHNRHHYRNRASIVRIGTIVASTLVTVFLGLQIAGLEVYFKHIAFVLGAMVTLLNALEPFYNFRALWVEHEQALAGFYSLKNDLDFYLSGVKPEELDVNALDKFRERHGLIWGQLSKSWIEHRKSGMKDIESSLVTEATPKKPIKPTGR